MELTGSVSEIRVIPVKLLRIKVNSFSARDSSVVLEIRFNDGTSKQIFRDTKVVDADTVAKRIIDDIISMEENINSEFDGEKLYNNAAIVIQNRDKTEKAIIDFFKTLHSNVEALKHAKVAEGYMDMVRKVTRMELRL